MSPQLEYEDTGNIGFMTWIEFNRFRNAVNDARRYLPWWWVAGHIRSGDPDEARRRSSEPQLPMPATWLSAHEIDRLLAELDFWGGNLEGAVNDRWGFEYAGMLTREVETAMARWPVEDIPHEVKYLRCRSCQRVALKYFPPTVGGGDITVKCTICRAVEDPKMFYRDALLIRMEFERARGRVDSVVGSAGSGEQIEADGVPVGEGRSGEDDTSVASTVVVGA